MNARAHLFSISIGAMFGAGLVLSGMTDPAKVRAFLDVRAWDPSLAFVMGAAVVTCTALYAIARRRTPVPDALVANRSAIDGRLISGAAIFGIGWGMVGVCPGPSIVVLGSGALWALVFASAMAVGARLASLLGQRREERVDGPAGGLAKTR